MRVLIVGGGKIGSHLAELLLADGYEVWVVEQRSDVLAKLHHELPTEVVMDGDGTRVETLERAHIRQADVLVAATGNDEANLAVAMIGRRLFQVPRIIGRVNNPKNAWLFTPEMGVDVALNQSDLLAKMIAQQMSLGDMLTLLRLRKGELVLVTEILAADAAVVGKTVAELALPPEMLLVAVIRGDEALVVHGHTTLQAGDEVLALVRDGLQLELSQRLGSPGHHWNGKAHEEGRL